MSCALLSLLLAASASSAEPVKLAAPGLAAVNMSDDVGTFYSDHFAHALTLEGVRVVTARQIQTLLGYERQKQLLGCSQDSSCMTELANALGVDGIITGQIGKFEDIYQLDIKIVSATTGRVLSAYSARATGDKRLLDELNRAAHKVAPELMRTLQRGKDAPVQEGPVGVKPPVSTPATVEATEPEKEPTMRDRAWIPLAGGGAALVAGVVFFAASKVESDRLTSGSSTSCQVGPTCSDLSYPLALHAESNEGTYQWLGVAFTAAAAVGVGIGAYMYFAGGSSQVSVAPLPGGGAVAWTGVFP